MSFQASQLSIFGWNCFSPAQVQITIASNGNIEITNAASLLALMPQQSLGTALTTQSYNLSIQDLLPQQSAGTLEFEQQADGTYKLKGSSSVALTKVGNQFQLHQKNGTIMVFRPDGQVEYVQDSNGYRINVSYNSSGLLTGLSTTSGDSFNFRYNVQGRVDQITDQAGEQTQFSYDSTGQLLTHIQDSAGNSVSYTYGNSYNPFAVTSVTDSNGNKITYDYDSFGRLQQQLLGDGQQQLIYRYDTNGNYTITDSTGAQTRVEYLSGGQVVQVTDPVGRVTQSSYDANGLLDKVTGPLGFQLDYNFCGCGELRSIVDALGNTTRFTYTTNGKLASVIDTRNNPLSFGYDAGGNLNTISYADGSQQRYAYNANGLLTSETNRRGQSLTYTYDSNYRLTQEQFADNSIVTYGYDTSTGLLNSIADSRGTTTITNNQATNQLVINYGSGRSLTYQFDSEGRRTQLVTQDGAGSRTVNYSYTALGQLDRLTDGAGSLIVDYDYDSRNGQLQRETNGNGSYTTYGYNLTGELTSVVNYATNGSVNSRFDYNYDALGRRVGMTTLEGTWAYTYDLNGQLTRGIFTSNNTAIAPNQDLSYEYDTAGNRIRTIENGVTQNYSTNNLNQYTNSGSTTYSYDADGNLVSKTTGEQTWAYTYNQENRLVRVVDNANNTTQYEYDVFGNRSATIYNGQRTSYMVDPFGMGDVLAEYDNSGNRTAQYTHGIGLVNRVGSGGTAYYDFDALGSTVGLTGTGGSVLNSYRYNPFGEDIFESETVTNPFEYVGQWGVTEESNGLDFMRARFYDSKLGRFTSMDPIGLQGQDTNLYRYAGNSPQYGIDPEGTVAIVPLAVAGGAGFATSFLLDCFATGGPLGTLAGTEFGRRLLVGARKARTFSRSVRGGSGIVSGIIQGGSILNPGTIALGGAMVGGALADKLCGPDKAISATPPPYTKPVKDGFPASGQLSSPLVLDLDNDGIELTNLTTSQTYFDVDGDGFREATGWVKADDGLLVRDLNNDSFINDNTELFGNNTAAQINSGFTKLKTLDTNNDGWISTIDTAFNSLQVWRDLDQDGISDPGELFTLNQLNISRISVNPTATNQTIEGNKILETAQYELTNGTQRTIVDAWFALDDMNSRYDFRSTHNTPVTLTNEILGLPNLKGYGTLPDLHIVMAKDAQLLTLVKDFTLKLNQQDLTGAKAMVQSILFRWAGVDSIASNSRGSYVDARELTFLEKFMGRPWTTSWTIDFSVGDNPYTVQGQALNQIYDQLENSLMGRLLIQHSVFNSAVSFDVTTDRVTYLSTYESAINQLDQISAQFVANPTPILELQQIELSNLLLDQQGYSVIRVGTGASDQFQLGFNGSNDFQFTPNADSVIYGLAGNDSITTNSGNDLLNGGSGDDVLNGYSGNDSLIGGSGNDTLIGDSNQDTLNGGLGNDVLQGGSENDIYQYDKGQGNDTLLDFSFYSSTPTNAGSDILEFGERLGRNDLTWMFDGRNLTFSVVGSITDKISIQDYIDPNRTIEKININGVPLSLTEIMTAYEGQDINGLNTLRWQSSSIKFNGLAGDDNIIASPYDDTLIGGDGNDTIDGQGGNNFIDGGNGDDVLKGYGSSNTISGGIGNDSLIGGYGNDSLVGGDGDDTLVSDQGNDLLDGGFGNDILQGGYGNDTYLFSKGQGTKTIWDAYVSIYPTYAGNDTLVFGSNVSRSDLTWFFDGKDLTFSVAGATTEKVIIQEFADTNRSIENITIAGTPLSLTEIMTAYEGQDINGLNTLSWQSSSIKFNGLAGDDNIISSSFNDTLLGGDGNDTIDAQGGNDFIDGGNGDDVLDGKDGNDTLDGGLGNDVLVGGTGNDSYFVDSISDVITESSTTAAEIDSVTATINYTLGANLENLTLGGITSINGTGNSLNNLITGNSAVNNLIGASGNDTLDGADGNDTLSGDDGNDSLIGGVGNDSLSGGAGNDILNGGIGVDTLIGGTGNDSYFVDSTSDVVTETSTLATEIDSVTSSVTHTLKANVENLSLSGNSAINGTGNTLNNQIIGNGANNSLNGQAGNDILSGAAGNDTLNGGDGNDSLAGDDGNDSLTGGLGNDTLIGGLGDDILVGGAGIDILTGSGGIDRFRFDINVIFNASTMGVDGISDFSAGTDKVVLDKTTFTVLNSAASSGFSVAGEFASVVDNAAVAVSTAYIVYSRGTGSLFYNQNGSASGLGTGGEFANLSGIPTITASDFIIQA